MSTETAVKKRGKPYTLEDRDGRQVRVYESGTVLDHETGKMVKPALHTVITPLNAREVRAQALERKHEKIAQAGNIVAQHQLKHSEIPALKALADDPDAYLMAIAIGRQKAAMDPDSPYANGAAEWITKHSGNDEPKQAEQAGPAASDPLQAALVGLVEAVTANISFDNSPYRKHKSTPETVDATVTPVHDDALPPAVDGGDDE